MLLPEDVAARRDLPGERRELGGDAGRDQGIARPDDFEEEGAVHGGPCQWRR